MIGACNAQWFGVHRGAHSFHHVGAEVSKQLHLDNFVFAPVPRYPVMQQPTPGGTWAWEFEEDIGQAEVYAILDADSKPVAIWEGATGIRPDLSSEVFPFLRNVPLRSGGVGASLIPVGGSAVRVLWFPQAFLDSIEALVSTASLPSWCEGGQYEGATCTEALQAIYYGYQYEAGLTAYTRTQEKTRYLPAQGELFLRNVLFLRGASRLLYAHVGDSLIPLMMNVYTGDQGIIVVD